MSYILDALRRAEADRERERSQVPGLHTQPMAGSEAAPAAGRRRWLPWAGAALLLLAGLGVGSWWAGSPHEATAPPPQPLPAPPATTAPVPAPMAPPVVSAPMPQAAASASPYLPSPPPPVVAAAATPTPAAPAPVAEAPIPKLSDLPEPTRRELPRLVIGGSVYSDDPASRLVIVNGEVLHEGARLGADLLLEQIGPHELVLRFRGQRYRQPI